MTLLEWSYCAEGKFKSKRIHVVPRQMLRMFFTWSALFMLEREVAVEEGAGPHDFRGLPRSCVLKKHSWFLEDNPNHC